MSNRCETCCRPLTHCFFPGDVTCHKVALAAALAANARLVELCEEYEAQWGDDYLAKKWELKEQLANLKALGSAAPQQTGEQKGEGTG